MGQPKNITERCNECVTIRRKMRELSLDTLPECKQVTDAMNTYVKDGVGTSGSVWVPCIHKHIVYKFSVQSHVESSVSLQHCL